MSPCRRHSAGDALSWELDTELPTPSLRSIGQMPGPTCWVKEIDRPTQILEKSVQLSAEYKFF